jgi:hypothetical protein
LEDTVTCLVRGPASRYPRGFIWLIPAWFVILSLAALEIGRIASTSGRLPAWLGLTEIGGLAIATVTAFCVVATMRQPAFRADEHGIRLGFSSKRKRPRRRQVQLAWPDIAQLRIVRRHYGAFLEITLGPAARIVHRPSVGRQALVLLGMLIMPFVFGRGSPALTCPRMDPPRYRMKICDISAADLQFALASVKPDEVRMLSGKLRFFLAPQRLPMARRPPTPVA